MVGRLVVNSHFRPVIVIPGSHSFTLNKLECSKQAVNALYNSAWDNGIGCWLISSEWFLSTTE